MEGIIVYRNKKQNKQSLEALSNQMDNSVVQCCRGSFTGTKQLFESEATVVVAVAFPNVPRGIANSVYNMHKYIDFICDTVVEHKGQYHNWLTRGHVPDLCFFSFSGSIFFKSEILEECGHNLCSKKKVAERDQDRFEEIGGRIYSLKTPQIMDWVAFR